MNKLILRFKALGDVTRFRIFMILSEKNVCVKGLAKKLNISESAVSQHLKVLREADLIKGEKVGYFVHYKVQTAVLKELEGVIGELARDVINIDETEKDFNCEKSGCEEE